MLITEWWVVNQVLQKPCLAKFSLNFMGLVVLFLSGYVHLAVLIFSQSCLVVSFFSGYVRLADLIFSQSCLAVSIFCNNKKVSKD